MRLILRDFQANIFYHGAGWAGCGQITSDNFYHACNSSQWIANLVGQACRQLPERRQVLGARHLGAMQALDFLAAFPQLLHHVIEIAAKVSDFIIALAKLTATFKLPSLTCAIFSCSSTMGR